MDVLSNEEVADHLRNNLTDWHFVQTSINREFTFRNFIGAFSFMTAVALEAEKMDHHPDWSNVYNKVSIKLSTHKPKGITRQDFELAAKIDAIFAKLK